MNVKKAVNTSFSINIIQIILIISLIIYMLKNENWRLVNSNFSEFLIFIIIILSSVINNFVITKISYNIIQSKNINENFKENLNDLDDLNKTLRSQRHDFLNHLQVVYNLIEMDEYTEVKKYINEVYEDIEYIGKILKTSIPAVNALLKAKMYSCKKRNINFKLNILTQLKNIKIPVWELCRVLGNIIDNAIDSFENVSIENKTIEFELDENKDYYSIITKDNGETIPQNLKTKIFQAGFTTKGIKGEGMGLAIVKRILAENNSTINLILNGNEKIFKIEILKHVESKKQ